MPANRSSTRFQFAVARKSHPMSTGQAAAEKLPLIFIVATTCGTRGPAMSMVAANAHGPAIAAKKQPIESKLTVRMALGTYQAAKMKIAQSAREPAPTPL